jgi:pimeloyl-ACP methyl ester carboxylesterase
MDTTRADVEFESCGASLRGWLFRNPDHAMAPGVVMAHGFTAVKEMFLEEYANAFCAAGFTVLVYDHHGFGASEGQPRQSPTPSVQLQGYRDAVHWLGQQSAVDRNRIAIWGSSFSGGHVAILAGEELSIRCAVAQVPGIVSGGPALSEATLAAMSAALTEGRLDDTLPAASATSDGLGIMYADGAYNWFSRVARERAPSWRNEIRIGALAEPHRPIDHLPNVKVPLLLIVAPDDVLTPPGPAVEIASGISLIDVVEIPGGHFDAYESGFSLSSSSAVSWFKRYL